MSRRNLLVLLAASAALIVSPAAADPECFGDSCRLPSVVEPPPAPVQQPAPAFDSLLERARNEAAPVPIDDQAAQARAEAPRPQPLAPPSARPVVVEQAARRPAPAIIRDFEPSGRHTTEPRWSPASRAEAPRRSGRVTARVVQGQIDAGPLVGYPLTPAPLVAGVPPVFYGYAVRPVYLVAPSAKIIHVDRGDDD
jgi:hypothetical protein